MRLQLSCHLELPSSEGSNVGTYVSKLTLMTVGSCLSSLSPGPLHGLCSLSWQLAPLSGDPREEGLKAEARNLYSSGHILSALWRGAAQQCVYQKVEIIGVILEVASHHIPGLKGFTGRGSILKGIGGYVSAPKIMNMPNIFWKPWRV